MDKIIEKLANDAVRESLSEVVTEMVSERMSELLGDEVFTEKLETLVNEKLDEAITPADKVEPRYKSVIEFVDGFIRPMWATTRNDQDTANWSKQWYLHPEAVARLNALWRIYEIQRGRDPENFLEEFLRVHADYHMRFLMAEESVFSRCSSTDTPSVPLPVVTAAA